MWRWLCLYQFLFSSDKRTTAIVLFVPNFVFFVSVEQLISLGCNHMNPRGAIAQRSVESSNAGPHNDTRALMLIRGQTALAMDRKIIPNLKQISFSFESSKFYQFCSYSCPFVLVCAIKFMAASPQFQE